MFVEFSVENFKSIKDRQYIQLEAEKSDYKVNNTFNIKAPRKLVLLKSVVIYGANASGKTNLIAALSNFHDYILNSTNLKNGQRIKWYMPFKFDENTRQAATSFSLRFVGPRSVLYNYEFSFDKDEVLYESLDFFPRGVKANIFTRKVGQGIKLGKYFSDKRIDKRIIQNQLFLSKLGNSGHTQMGDIYMYFRTMILWSIPAKSQLRYLMSKIQQLYVEEKSHKFRKRLDKLMKIADTKIEGVSVSKRDFTADEYSYLGANSGYHKYRTVAKHKIYKNGKLIGIESIDINEESVGTQVLFALGGMILDKLEKGGVLVIDELDNSLHPRLSRFLVELFLNEKTNPQNAQLIFATHETALLDGLFRKDQVCFVEKSDEGATTIFDSASFTNMKPDAPLHTYYMRGQLGGNPNIRSVEFIYSDDDD